MTLRIQRVYNRDLIKSIVPKEEFDASETRVVWLAATSGDDDKSKLHGVFILRPLTLVLWDFKAYLREDNNAGNKVLGEIALRWVFKHSPAKKLTSSVPLVDKDRIKYLQRLGFLREGVNKRSFLRGEELIDQQYLGLSRDH